MVWTIGHYPDCNSGPPCLVVDDYKKKHKSLALPPVCFLKIQNIFWTNQFSIRRTIFHYSSAYRQMHEYHYISKYYYGLWQCLIIIVNIIFSGYFKYYLNLPKIISFSLWDPHAKWCGQCQNHLDILTI